MKGDNDERGATGERLYVWQKVLPKLLPLGSCSPN